MKFKKVHAMNSSKKGQALNLKNQVRLYAPTHISDSSGHRKENQEKVQLNRTRLDKRPVPATVPSRNAASKNTENMQNPNRTGQKRREQAKETNKLRIEGYNVHKFSKDTLGDESAGASKKPKAQSKQKRVYSPKQKLLYAAAAVGTIGVLIGGYFLFLVEDIVIEGASNYSAEDIISISGLETGRHMMLCDTEAAYKRLEADPYLKVRSIELEFPRTIRISIKERKEIAAIAAQGYDVIIDCEGHVLAIGELMASNRLMRVIGMSQVGFHVNEPLGTGSDLQVKTLITLIEQLKFYGLIEEVSEADLSNPLRVSLLTTDGITVVVGQPDNIKEKLAWMRDVLPSLRSGENTTGVLDVSAKGGAIYSPATPPAFQEEPEVPEEPLPQDD